MEEEQLKNTITEMKNTLEGINSRLENTEKQIRYLENGTVSHQS